MHKIYCMVNNLRNNLCTYHKCLLCLWLVYLTLLDCDFFLSCKKAEIVFLQLEALPYEQTTELQQQSGDELQS